MKSIKCQLLLIIAFFTLQGCSAMERELLSGDSSSIVKHFDENKLTFNEAQPKHQLTLCHSFLSVKRFTDFNECMKSYQKKIPIPQILMFTPGLGNGQYWLNADYGVAFKYGMKAQAAFDLGQYNKAKEFALAAYGAANRFPNFFIADAPSQLGDMDYSKAYRTFVIIQPAAILALISAINNDYKTASKYISVIESLDTSSSFTSYYKPYKESRLALAYLAIEQPKKAHKILTNTESSLSNDMMTALSTFDVFDSLAVTDLENHTLLCRSFYAMEQVEEAKKCYLKVVNSPFLESLGNLHFSVLYDLGSIEARKKEWDDASAYYERAINVLELQRSSISLDGQKIGFVTERMSIYERMIEVQLQLNQPAIAFEYVERAKSRALVDLLASKKSFGENENPESELLIAQIDTASGNALAITTKEGTRSIRGLKRNIQTKYTQLSSLTTVEPVGFKKLTDIIPKNETLVEYYGEGDNWYAFVIENSKVFAIKLDITNLETSISNLREQILDTDNSSYQSTSATLYNALFKPLKPFIHNKNITIVPHGALHYLPFNALYGGNGFLIDHYAIRLLPSISVLPLIKNSKEKRGELLILGDPDLNDNSLDLPYAQKEALVLNEIIENSSVFIRNQASETRLKEKSHSANIIHIASHGIFDPQTPLNSRLLLSADAKNDGNLTVSDIYDLNLSVDLITLSACETGIGDIKTGDDVIGLTRGFLFAGASSIVSSLWVVDDKATQELMVSFYSDMLNKSKRYSLREAQLKVKNTYNSHPFYWAAFQLTGKG